jgi:hypothetical protein
MLVAYTVNHREIDQAEALAQWIVELGGAENHDALLCLTRPAQRFEAESRLKPILEKAFKSVTTFVPYDEVEIPWPNENNDARSPNHFFKRIVQRIDQKPQPFLWLEMDAVPLKSTWLNELEAEYQGCKKPFMGVPLEVSGRHYMSGIAVYPPQVGRFTPRICNAGSTPFDVFAGNDTSRMMHATSLIQYVRFNPDAPADWSVFHEPMRPDAVLYHRSKDLSLIDYLKTGNLPPAEHGAVGELQSASQSPAVETLGGRAPVAEPTISDSIRTHCDALLEIANSNPGRRTMVITELRKRRLRK